MKETEYRSKSRDRAFKQRFKATNNGLTIKIQSGEMRERLSTFTTMITGHYTYIGEDNGLEALKTLEKELKREVAMHCRINNDVWRYLILDMDYPETAFKNGSTFVQLDVTGRLRWDVGDYKICKRDVEMVKDLMLEILDEAPFTFTEKKVK